MLEVYLILDYFGHHRQHRSCCTRLNGGLSDYSMDTGLTQTDIEYIAKVIEMDDKYVAGMNALQAMAKAGVRISKDDVIKHLGDFETKLDELTLVREDRVERSTGVS